MSMPMAKSQSNSMKTSSQKDSGFTLVEIIVALSVFLIVMTISMGSIIGIFDANRKGEAQKTVMNSLNFVVETMSREMRYGKNYLCLPAGVPNCPSASSDAISFDTMLSGVSEPITYYFNAGTIMKIQNGVALPVTGPEITITTLQFYVQGNDPAPATTQPRVRIRLHGYAGSNPKNQSDFRIQTVVSQRDLNN